MHLMDMSAAVAQAQRADLLADAAGSRGARLAESGRRGPALDAAEVVIRLARPADAEDLERLRQLDGRPRGWGRGADVLVAVADGVLVAALPLARVDDVIADPFRRTAGVVRLLEERARQLARPLPARGRPRPAVAVRAR